MRASKAIDVFLKAYPVWGRVSHRLTAKQDGANDLIVLDGLSIGRVWQGVQDGRQAVFAELLISPPENWR